MKPPLTLTFKDTKMACNLTNFSTAKIEYQFPVDTAEIRKIPLLNVMTRSLALAGFLLLAACGDDGSSKQTAEASAASPQPANPEPEKSVSLNLRSTPLDKKVYLGIVIPEVEEAAPCPFLSDEAAFASVKTNWILKRRETSNQQCYWSKNLGFSIKVTVEPLATAKPVQSRAYNMDSPPVLKQQPAPGNNAVVLYDTTWDKEQAYAMAFEQDSKLVMIYVTGMETDAERLSAAAKEVSAKLATAAIIDSPQDNAGAFNICTTWAESEIAEIIGTPVKATMGKLDCKWETGEGANLKQVRVTIYGGKTYPWESVLEQRGSTEVPDVGERGIMEKKRKRSNMPGHVLLNALYDEKLVTVSVTDTIADYKAVALALSKNIDKRLK